MALPRSLVRLRWLLLAVPPAVTAMAIAPPAGGQDAHVRALSAVAISRAEVGAVLEPRDRPRPSAVAREPEADRQPAPTPAVAGAPRAAGQEVFSGPATSGKVALTFDDGPSAELTPGVLDTLRAHGVRATFFVLGRRAADHAALLTAIDADGHEIGNHGWSHQSLRSLFPADIERELDDTNAAVRAATGKTPALFRPPFGRYAPSAVPLVAARGMNLVLWNADGRDWDGDADAIVDRVVSQARPGAIILLHDRRAATARALPRILEGLARKGLTPVPVSELTGLPSEAGLPSDAASLAVGAELPVVADDAAQ